MTDYPYREFRFKRTSTDELTLVVSRELFTEEDEQLLASNIDEKEMHQILLQIAQRDTSKSSSFSMFLEPVVVEFIGERDIWAG